jgi:molybdenum cofactor biosynthesis protein B
MSSTVNKHKDESPNKLNFALVVCSTSRYLKYSEEGFNNDISGNLIEQHLKKHGHQITSRKIIPDKKSVIQHVLLKMLKSRKINVIIMSGGTGISPKDVTIEAVQQILEKELPGFGELFRNLSYRTIGSAALMSRALAGIVKGKVIFCLPGSPNSVSLALENLILPEVSHIIKHANE